MENKRKALGKGLEQLFSGEAFNLEEFEKNVVDNANKDEIVIYPTVSRLIAKTKDIEKDIVKQTSLFGGSDEL